MSFIKCPKCGREEPSFDYAHVCGPVKVKSNMNERIRELWTKCVIKHTKDPMNWQMVADEFAELIIQECADLVDNHDDSYPYVSFGDMIKEHFGVKS